jgi:hypothetical protein
MNDLRRSAVSILAVVLLAAPAFAQQNESEREKIERVPDILTALAARDGAHIADLGSSDGF